MSDWAILPLPLWNYPGILSKDVRAMGAYTCWTDLNDCFGASRQISELGSSI